MDMCDAQAFAAVDGRHADDGVDAVVVEQKGQQQQERLSESPDLVERVAETTQRPRATDFLHAPVTVGTLASGSLTPRKRGTENSAHQIATARNAARHGSGILGGASPSNNGKSKPSRLLDPEQNHDQQQPRPEVSDVYLAVDTRSTSSLGCDVREAIHRTRSSMRWRPTRGRRGSRPARSLPDR